MGDRVACHTRDQCIRVRSFCGEGARGAARRQRYGAALRNHWIWLHDFCGTAGSKETSSNVAAGPGTGVDARASLAGIADAADDPFSWRIPFWRDADERIDVAFDYHGCKRSVRRGAATLSSERDDHRCEAGDDLR